MDYEPGPHLLLNYRENFYLAVPLRRISGVYPKGDITPIPNPDKGILGIANLEGKIVPIQDVATRFDLKVKEEEGTYIILLQTFMGEIGILVPIEFNVEQISQAEIDEALKTVSEENSKEFLIISGKEKKFILLDVSRPRIHGELLDSLKSYFDQKD